MAAVAQTTQIDIANGPGCRSYLMPSGARLSAMEYRALQGSALPGFASCVCSRWNGRLKLTYFTERRVTLTSLMSGLTSEQYLDIAYRVLQGVVAVQKNGFLDPLKTDLSVPAVYVDPATSNVSLIYLPIEGFQAMGGGASDAFAPVCQALMSPLRNMSQLAGAFNVLNSAALSSAASLATMLGTLKKSVRIGNVELQLSDAQVAAMEGPDSNLVPPDTGSQGTTEVGYVLCGAGIRVPVRRGSMTIGKNHRRADFSIAGDPTVSNVHCRVTWGSNGLEVHDLESTNGTFVNGRRLPRGGSSALHVGDVLGVSSVELTVRAGE